MYQNGLVRVTPKADATGNRVGIAVIEAAVIPNPEEICPEMCPRILGPALMTATPCAFVGNAPEYSRISFALDHTIADRCRVEETDKGKLSDRPPLHIPGKNKGKGKFTPQRLRERLRPRLRERIRQRFWKRSRKGQRPHWVRVQQTSETGAGS